jgi:predicted 3-demethylubiquinone-9 3-methyltransferase (glyoxalase superfamily)
MFLGVAEEAMNLYTSFLADSEILRIYRYGPGEQGAEGTIKRAAFTLGGQDFICIDSPPVHDFTFTPSISIFVDCESETELQEAFDQLSAGGEVLMPLDDYGFSSISSRFGWINDRFGVSWQLNLP